MATVKLPHVTEERALEATLVIKVTKSLIGPHRVILGDHGHFYARTSTGKYRLDVSDLRQAFGASARLFDRIRDFHVDRLLRVGRRAYDLLLQRGSHHVEHVPLAFGRQALAPPCCRRAWCHRPAGGRLDASRPSGSPVFCETDPRSCPPRVPLAPRSVSAAVAETGGVGGQLHRCLRSGLQPCDHRDRGCRRAEALAAF